MPSSRAPFLHSASESRYSLLSSPPSASAFSNSSWPNQGISRAWWVRLNAITSASVLMLAPGAKVARYFGRSAFIS